MRAGYGRGETAKLRLTFHPGYSAALISQSALNFAAARLRHIAGTAWSTKRYLNIELLKEQQMRGAITA